MDVTVQIGAEVRDLASATESWINDQLRRREREGASICVIVTVKTSGVDLALRTPSCGGGVGGRQANAKELEIIELWNRRHLNSNDFTGGNLIAFLKQLG